ncbi:TPA: DEAD/DEAH box helicase, partial [Streptococcus pyogenes]|nr:DEAD/DEAH box helicase [Streptococcus pyogenes]HES6068195.1 DEAD/DEAH box helicase [Streptococcus pyogenes]
HPQSAGHGLNLQKGGHIIVWFGLTWSLEYYQQANARLDRQGQTEPVIVHHIVAENTVDEKVLRILQGKEKNQNALLEAVKAQLGV